MGTLKALIQKTEPLYYAATCVLLLMDILILLGVIPKGEVYLLFIIYQLGAFFALITVLATLYLLRLKPGDEEHKNDLQKALIILAVCVLGMATKVL